MNIMLLSWTDEKSNLRFGQKSYRSIIIIFGITINQDPLYHYKVLNVHCKKDYYYYGVSVIRALCILFKDLWEA